MASRARSARATRADRLARVRVVRREAARLAFPRTEFQGYGNTVILYTAYEMDVEKGGETRTERGLATEIFVHQRGQWLNTGWHWHRRRAGSTTLPTR